MGNDIKPGGATAAFSERALALGRAQKSGSPPRAAEASASGAVAEATFSDRSLALGRAQKASGPPERAAGALPGARASAEARAESSGAARGPGKMERPSPTGIVEKARQGESVAPTLAPFAPSASSAEFSISRRGAELAGGQPAPARTIDAGAPLGSGSRLRAYGQAQQASEVKGSGFDGTA